MTGGRMRCTCCGQWYIEVTQYAMAARKVRGKPFKVSHGPVLIGDYRTMDEVIEALRVALGPPLANFTEEPAG